MEIVAFVLLGLIAGFFAGLLGVGGGIVTVPVMSLLILPYLDFPSEHIMHIAVASSLAAIIPTSIMSAYGHHRQGGVVWPIAIKFTPGLLLGGISGALMASHISTDALQLGFAFFLIFVAIYMLFSPESWIQPVEGRDKIFSGVSFPIAFLSAVLGVGGGTMTVPYLLWRGIDIRKAVGISAYCGLPIAIASSITFFVIQQSELIESQVDFLYLPAALGISLGSIFFAPIGAKFTQKLPVLKIKQLFAFVLVIASVELFGFY